jgi:hypothetical protein
MTKKELLLEEFKDVLEKTTITKTGAFNALLKHMFEHFTYDELVALLQHIIKERGDGTNQT